MNKKVIMSLAIVFSVILAGFTLVIIARSTETKNSEKQKESPLYKIRVGNILNKRFERLKERFLEDRIFITPMLNFVKSINNIRREPNELATKGITCHFTVCYGTMFCGISACGVKCHKL